MSEYLINISVKTAYLEEHSQPHKNRYAFSYTISIENACPITTQLLSRHWIITDAKNITQEVVGDGVIGQQPHILPGDTYTYSSSSLLETTVGTMEGTYTMRTEDGKVFNVPIPLFSLACPKALH